MKTKRKQILYITLVMLTVVVMIFVATFASGCTDKNKKGQSDASSGFITGDEINNGDDNSTNDSSQALVIPVSDLTTKASFYGITIDGTYMEVIAFKSGSEYRTAFNTCQVCYGSRNAYYVQSGSNLVCQNCGNKFALSNVGIKTNYVTCSPYPILASDRKDTDNSLVVPYEFLVSAKSMFKTWKVT